jgi:hypothetical protein
MHPFKKLILSQVYEQQAPVAPTTELAQRSSLGYATTTETNICAATIDTGCRILTQTTGQITSGDIMYEADGVTPFDGGAAVGGTQAYYNVKLSAWTTANGSRVCLINNDGFMNVDTICNI